MDLERIFLIISAKCIESFPSRKDKPKERTNLLLQSGKYVQKELSGVGDRMEISGGGISRTSQRTGIGRLQGVL